MSFLKNFSLLYVCTVALLSIGLRCDLPDDPSNPSNTSITAVFRTPDGKIHDHYVVDTVGRKLEIGSALRLPGNIDSIALVITFEKDTLVDTLFTEYGKPDSYYDTIWFDYTFYAPGIFYATFIPYTSLNVEPVTANITMAEAEVMPENNRPVISVTGTTILRPGETCVLAVKKTDPDEYQTLTGAVKGKPLGAVFVNDTFTWVVPESFTGTDTVIFIVTDNGYPSQSDSETVIITVTTTPHPPVITVTGDGSLKPFDICTLMVATSDEDEDQELTVSVEGNPDGSELYDDSLFIWSVPEIDSADYDVTFTVTDDGEPPFSTSVTVTLHVRSEEQPEIPHWTTDTITHTMSDTSTYTLDLATLWSDDAIDEADISLLSGDPDGDAIDEDTYSFTADADAVGSYLVAIEAKPADDHADTLIIKLTIEPHPETDLSLAQLKLSIGNLTEVGAPVPDTIRDTVPADESSIVITPTVTDSRVSIKVEGETVASGDESDPITLETGENRITITTNDPDGAATRTYIVMVVRKFAAVLSSLELSAGTHSGPYDPVPDTLRDTVPFNKNSITITPTALDEKATITVQDDEVASGNGSDPVALETGENRIAIKVIDADGTTSKTYVLFMVRKFDGTTLSSLKLSSGTLTEQSAPVPDTMRDTVSYMDSTITVTPTAGAAGSTIQVKGKTVSSGKASDAIALVEGVNEVPIKVTASGDEGSKTYQLYVIRKPNSTIELTTPPSGLVATTVSVSSIKVQWDDVFGANAYTVNRSEEEDGTYTTVKTVTSNAFTDTDLDAGTTYYYRVNASNTNNSTGFSDAAGATTWLKPSFKTHPADKSAMEGGKAEFSVTVQGIPAPAYQWQKNGADIEGATSAAYTTPALTLFDNAATFRCIITNSAGAATSNGATLTVNKAATKPAISGQPQDVATTEGKTATFSVTASGYPTPTYQWQKDGTNIAQATGTSYTTPSLSLDDNGTKYRCVVTNSAGWVTSDAATLTVNKAATKPAISSQPQDVATTEGKTATFSVMASGYPTPTYQWQKDGTNIAQATGTNYTTPSLILDDNGAKYRCVVTNSAGSVTSDAATLTVEAAVVKPAITKQPEGATVVTGGSVELSVTATGTSLEYQWQKGDSPVSGATSNKLSLTGVTTANAGNYTVKVSNSAGYVVSSAAKLLVLPKMPTGLTATIKSATSVEVKWNKADGALWYRVLRANNGGEYAKIGQIEALSYLDEEIAAGGAYTYRLVAGNDDGISEMTAAVSATAWSGPTITSQPKGVTVKEGETITLTVAASVPEGSPACTYQWKKDGSNLSGKTDATLKITSADSDDDGEYMVVVSNSVKSVESDEVTVKVTPMYTLTVTSSPAAGGSVAKDKTGESFPSGTQVTLTATAKSGYRFDAWSGDASGTGPSVTVTMTKNMAVTAGFIPQYTLTMATSDKGTVTPAGQTTVDEGDEIDITATPGTGFRFKKWSVTSGSATFTNSTSASTKVKLTSNATVTAEFGGVTFAKQVQITGYSEIRYVDAIQTEDGGYLVIGNNYPDLLLVKIDSNGNLDWNKVLPSQTGETIQNAVSGYVITGRTVADNSSNIRIGGFRQDGTEIWYSEFGNIAEQYYQGSKTKVSSDGGYIIIGSHNNDLELIKTYESRYKEWQQTFTGNTYYPNDIQETDDGYVIVGAVSQGFGSFIIKTDKQGEKKWETSLIKYLQIGDVSSVSLVDNGYYVMSGGGMKDGQSVGYLATMPQNDTTQMKLYYYDDISIRMMEETDDGYFVTGSNASAMLVAKIDKSYKMTGKVTSGASSSYGRGIKVTKDGGAIAVGDNNWVIKTDENGKVE